MAEPKGMADFMRRFLGHPCEEEPLVSRRTVELLPQPYRRDKGDTRDRIGLAEDEVQIGSEQVTPVPTRWRKVFARTPAMQAGISASCSPSGMTRIPFMAVCRDISVFSVKTSFCSHALRASSEVRA